MTSIGILLKGLIYGPSRLEPGLGGHLQQLENSKPQILKLRNKYTS